MWTPSGQRTSHPVEGGGVDAVAAEHPVEVDHADLARIGLRHLAHQCVVGLRAGRRVLRPGHAVGLPVTRVDVGHGEQHHSGTNRVEDGNSRLEVRGQMLVPGGLTDVDPLPVEQVVGHLPPAQPEGDHLGPLPGRHEGPQAAPQRAALRGRSRAARDEDLQLRVEVTAQRSVVGDRDAVLGLGPHRQPHAQGQGDGVAEDEEPDGVPAIGPRALQRGVLRRAQSGRQRDRHPLAPGGVRPRRRRRPGRQRRQGEQAECGRHEAGHAEPASHTRSRHVRSRPPRRRPARRGRRGGPRTAVRRTLPTLPSRPVPAAP